jgi:hypothetical protein
MNDGAIITERSTVRDPHAGDTCGSWRRHDGSWKPDVNFFRCRMCKAVVPESLFTDADLHNSLCGYCKREVARRAPLPTSDLVQDALDFLTGAPPVPSPEIPERDW